MLSYLQKLDMDNLPLTWFGDNEKLPTDVAMAYQWQKLSPAQFHQLQEYTSCKCSTLGSTTGSQLAGNTGSKHTVPAGNTGSLATQGPNMGFQHRVPGITGSPATQGLWQHRLPTQGPRQYRVPGNTGSQHRVQIQGPQMCSRCFVPMESYSCI